MSTITHGAKTVTLRRIALGPMTLSNMTDYDVMTKLERLEQRARDLDVNVSTWRRSMNAPQVGSEYRVTVVGSKIGSFELRADGDLLAIIAGALDDYEAAWSTEELLTIAAQSGLEVSRG